jgi:hypothetical protein
MTMMRHVAASEVIRDKAVADSLMTLEASKDDPSAAALNLGRVNRAYAEHKERLVALEAAIMGDGLAGLVAGDRIGQPHRVHIDTLSPQVLAFLKRARVL